MHLRRMCTKETQHAFQGDGLQEWGPPHETMLMVHIDHAVQKGDRRGTGLFDLASVRTRVLKLCDDAPDLHEVRLEEKQQIVAKALVEKNP